MLQPYLLQLISIKNGFSSIFDLLLTSSGVQLGEGRGKHDTIRKCLLKWHLITVGNLPLSIRILILIFSRRKICVCSTKRGYRRIILAWLLLNCIITVFVWQSSSHISRYRSLSLIPAMNVIPSKGKIKGSMKRYPYVSSAESSGGLCHRED